MKSDILQTTQNASFNKALYGYRNFPKTPRCQYTVDFFLLELGPVPKNFITPNSENSKNDVYNTQRACQAENKVNTRNF